LSRALEYREKKSGQPGPVALKRAGLFGNSPRLNACLDIVAQAAKSDANVLIVGETGTGKELFARAIHENSGRSGKDFVVVDCTVLPDTLAESVLFGHRRGAFTGADRSHDGLVKQADGGSLFLDEVGELPLNLQKSFLRVLQERTFRPVGENRELKSDFRLIAATNRDLDRMADCDRFRRDLLFRLRTIILELPPLRERLEDVKEIVLQHVARICDKNRLETKGFSPEFFQVLQLYRWPGNVRELVNALESAVTVDPFNPVLFPKHLPSYIRTEVARLQSTSSPGNDAASELANNEAAGEVPKLPTLKMFRNQSMAELELHYLQKLMAITAGNIKEACRISGLSRTRLYELMKQHNLSRRLESA
jgi:two-component system NtrC family response regulator